MYTYEGYRIYAREYYRLDEENPFIVSQAECEKITQEMYEEFAKRFE